MYKVLVKCLFLWMLCMLMAGCGNQTDQINEPKEENQSGFIPAKPGMYDSADTAVVMKKNTSDAMITFFNLKKERRYTLEYDGTSKLYDRYGASISMEQVQEGDIVDITFLKQNKKLNSLQMSLDAWELKDVSRFEIREKQKEMSIGEDVYRFYDGIKLFSKGKEIEFMDINQVDHLNVQGIGHTVYSIMIDKGHGYLRLKNEEYFWDGWIEVGQTVIQKITEDMLLVVPEGTYDVLLSVKGISGTKKAVIKRDEETELDVADLKKEEEKKFGNLLFALTPDYATVYIDGEEIDLSVPFAAEYGIHQMMAKAEGYQTIIQYIKVGQENATIQVVMEKEKADDQTTSSVSSNQTSVSSNDPVSTSGYKVTIDAPTGAEVYVDGRYIGIVPISFAKEEGIHVVTLRKNGYETRSYTIQVDGTSKDASFSFSELAESKSDSDKGD